MIAICEFFSLGNLVSYVVHKKLMKADKLAIKPNIYDTGKILDWLIVYSNRCSIKRSADRMINADWSTVIVSYRTIVGLLTVVRFMLPLYGSLLCSELCTFLISLF